MSPSESWPVLCYFQCLLYIDLAFAEDIKSINFPSLENASKEVTEEQYAAIDDLIESMDLMSADK